MDNITIRKFEEKDKSALATLFEESLKYFSEIDPLDIIQLGPNYGEWSVGSSHKKIEKGGIILVAEISDTVVGFIVGSIKPLSEEEKMELKPIKYGTIQELHVSKDYRNRGIGTELLQEVEEYFKKQNCGYSMLNVFDPNTVAVDLYKKLNYENRINTMIKTL